MDKIIIYFYISKNNNFRLFKLNNAKIFKCVNKL